MKHKRIIVFMMRCDLNSSFASFVWDFIYIFHCCFFFNSISCNERFMRLDTFNTSFFFDDQQCSKRLRARTTKLWRMFGLCHISWWSLTLFHNGSKGWDSNAINVSFDISQFVWSLILQNVTSESRERHTHTHKSGTHSNRPFGEQRR